MRTLFINERQYRLLRYGNLNEYNFNLHYSHDDNHDMKPYGSDSKYMMFGRETGHFGSGTYFSTYKGSKERKEYIDDTHNFDPHFIKVSDHVYRVDFDLYKNLYRVRTKRQGDVLYTLLKNVNALHNRVCQDVFFNKKFSQRNANYNNSKQYQIIKANASALNLKCPSYLELMRMAQNHTGDQSFSTVFMEYNGYNGVNVSGVEYYDNTKHGSVIYDLSKVNTDMEEVSPNSLWTLKDKAYDETVIYDEFNDLSMKALQGTLDYDDVEKLPSLSLQEAMRVLKNYTDSGNILRPIQIEELGDDLSKRYLSLLYHKNPRNDWGDNLNDELLNSRCASLILKARAYYWVNYESKKGSMLVELLNTFSRELDWNLSTEEENAQKKVFLDNLMRCMQRDLTDWEREYIEEDYYYTEDN